MPAPDLCLQLQLLTPSLLLQSYLSQAGVHHGQVYKRPLLTIRLRLLSAVRCVSATKYDRTPGSMFLLHSLPFAVSSGTF